MSGVTKLDSEGIKNEGIRGTDRSGGGWIASGTTCQREKIVRVGSARPGSMKATHTKHRPHVKLERMWK